MNFCIEGVQLIEKAYELSPMQQGMLFHAIGEVGSGVDIEQIVCQLDERLNTAAMLRAWDLIASRHTVLRTAFAWEGIAEPLQQVRDSVQIPFEFVDWRNADAAEQAARWDRLLAADRKQGFDVSRAPLMRLHIVQLGESSYRLLWTFHHVLLDGRSFPIVLREVFAAYTAFRDDVPGGPQLVPRKPYYDYIEWLRTQDLSEAELFFREKLKGFRAPTPIPSSASGEASAWGVAQCRLSEALTGKLSVFAKTIGVTVNTLLQGAWALLLHHHSGEEDIVFGATRAGRASTLNDADSPVGLFINTLPMRISVRPSATVGDWLREIREQHVSLRPYEQTPLRIIHKASEVPGGIGLFNSILVFENYLLDSALRAQDGEWTNRHFEYIGQTNFPLTLIVYADHEMVLRLEHNSKCLDALGAERVLGHVRTLLEGICMDAARSIASVPFLTEKETSQLLASPRAASQVNECLHQRFERRAARTPGVVAITCDGESLTYAELNRRANAVAHRLVSLGAGPEVLIGLCVERNLGMVIGILGILKAGAAYLPIDLNYPPERVAFMLKDAGVPVLLSQRSLQASLPKHQATVLLLDDVTDGVDETPDSGVKPENLAYVIYTSGSTGKPKGCQITHANVVRLFDQTDHWYGFQPSDVWTLFHSCAFDFSVWEIWGALLYGGKVVVVPYWVSRSPEAFAELLRRERVTVLNQTPSAFRQLTPFVLATIAPTHQTLRYVIFGGEALELASLLPWMEQYGDSKPSLINMYGITETTVHVTYRPITFKEVRAGSGSLIGEPIPDLAVYVLNPQRQPVPLGVAGEMYVGGAGVARGYLRRPELTAQRFIENPFAAGYLYRTGDLARRLPNGDLEYLGRIDHQVKIRGFRIELGEIESVISSYPGIREVVVIAREDKPADKKLVAYYCAAQEIALDALRAHMKASLPDYMVPAVFMPMEALPLTSNGKVDRVALPPPDVSRASRKETYVAPRTAAEQALARIWSEVLGVEATGVHDNFFELGGDSILSIQVISRARQAGLSITPHELFQSPTIAGLAAIAPQANAPAQVEAASGDVALTPIQQWFFEQPLENRHYWNQTFLFAVPPGIDVDRLQQALVAAVIHHDAFRLRFAQTSSGWQQSYVDHVAPVTIERAGHVSTPEEILSAAVKLQSSLDITQGPLMAAMYFPISTETPAKEEARLLLTVHHLAIDGVSWRLLLEDVESAYRALQEARPIALPPKTASYKAWSKTLAEYAERPEVRAQIDYWLAVPDATAAELPLDHAAGLNIEESTETVTARLTTGQTALLLRQVPAMYHSQINDLLLTALAESFRPWIGRESLLLDVEGHGREDIGAIDVSRTVGWFTSIYPVRLSLKSGVRLDASLQSVKNQLRQIPNKGIGYGLLRDQLTGLPQAGFPHARFTQANVLFNYLGQFDQVVAGSQMFSFAAEPVGLWHHARNKRTHLIEVLARVAGGQLEVQFNFSRNVHSRPTVEQIAARYSAALVELINLSSASDVQRWAVADFPLAKLDAPELARILKSHPTLEDIYPLSSMQKLFYSMEASAGQLGFEQWRFVLRGPLDTAELRRAWQRVIERHPILRTAFVSAGLHEAMQVVRAARPLEWTEIDLRDVPESERQQRLAQTIAADRTKTFDLAAGQLLRLILLRTRDDEWQMVWSTHHLLIDGWSWPVIFNELAQLYKDDTALPKPRPYRDYIVWTLSRSDSDAQNFWRGYLQDFTPQPLRIGQRPAVIPVSARTSFGEETARLEEDVTQALQNTARENQITLNTVLQGAWAMVLAHYQSSANPVFGAAYSGRPPEIAGIEGMVGPCVNNLPVRTNIAPEMPTAAWLQQLQREQSDAGQHQYNSIEQIQGWSGIPWRHRLFDSLIVFQNYASGGAAKRLSEGVTVDVADAPESTNYPLTLTVVPGAMLRLKMLYRAEQFEAVNIRRVLSDLGLVLREIAKDPRAKLSEIISQLAPPPAVAAGVRLTAAAGAETTPRTEMERTLAGIWQELFDNPCISLEANFFDLGGHSLLLVQAHRKLQQAIGRSLPVVTLLQYPTVRALASQLAGNGDPRLAAQAVNDRARLQQQAMTRMKAARKG
jgi:amino acid adenylation domain-containing protein/non-ribosomal peptide synthase protein (TIGR01720 family)